MAEHKDHAQVKAPPPILTLIHIAVAYVLAWTVPIRLTVPNAMRLAGFAMVIIGFIFGVAAFLAFRKARTTLDPRGKTTAMVTDGIYRFTRNPIYLGFLLMLIGVPLNSGSYWGVALSPIFIVLMNRLVIQREEAYLEKKFGDVYTSYKSRVRRWL